MMTYSIVKSRMGRVVHYTWRVQAATSKLAHRWARTLHVTNSIISPSTNETADDSAAAAAAAGGGAESRYR